MHLKPQLTIVLTELTFLLRIIPGEKIQKSIRKSLKVFTLKKWTCHQIQCVTVFKVEESVSHNSMGLLIGCDLYSNETNQNVDYNQYYFYITFS